MNKRELIDAVSGRLGDKKSATEAVNAVLETFFQLPNKGCLTCHVGAPTASGKYMSSYSFTFSNATTPPSQ